MNHIPKELLQKANTEAIYNVYLYLAHKTPPTENEHFGSIVSKLESALINTRRPHTREIYRLEILKNAVNADPTLSGSVLTDFTRSDNGLTACSFTKPGGDISVIFKGTGSGEWIDNGEGLSGIPEENTYITYAKNNMVMYRQTVWDDFATDQQVEALNWFYSIVAKNRWNSLSKITVSGHSKGGNKAQFVTIHSDLVTDCYSFDGQGFSPEALAALKEQYGFEYQKRRSRIRSFAAANDYVSVLGEPLVPENQIYYFHSRSGIHYMEAILDKTGKFYPQCSQGKLSAYAKTVSDELMSMKPSVRQHATLGVMNIFQKYLGKGVPVNGDAVSIEKTIAGIGIAITSFLSQLHKIKDI